MLNFSLNVNFGCLKDKFFSSHVEVAFKHYCLCHEGIFFVSIWLTCITIVSNQGGQKYFSYSTPTRPFVDWPGIRKASLMLFELRHVALLLLQKVGIVFDHSLE